MVRRLSSQWLPLLWSTSARTRGLSSGSSQAPEHRLHACGAQAQSLHSTWTLPRWGIESVSPALEGGLFTSEPPKKPCHWNSERDCIESVDCFEWYGYGWWFFFFYLFIGQASSQHLIVTQGEGLLTWGSLGDTSIHCREEKRRRSKNLCIPSLVPEKEEWPPTLPWQLVHIRGWGNWLCPQKPCGNPLQAFKVQLKCQLQPMMLSDLSSFSRFRWQLQFVP